MSTIYRGLSSLLNPEDAHTTQEFIVTGKTSNPYDYLKFSITENIDGVLYVVHNVLDDYIDLLKERSKLITLTPEEADTYRYNPKKLSDKIYGSTQYYHIILRINDMASTHDFTLPNRQVRMIGKDALLKVMYKIYSQEKNTITRYSTIHSKDTTKTTIINDRLVGTK